MALVFGDGVFVSDSWERRKLIDWVTVLQGLELFEHLGDLAGAKPSTPYILPVPFTNQINGGVHSGNPLAMQEFMVSVPAFPVLQIPTCDESSLDDPISRFVQSALPGYAMLCK